MSTSTLSARRRSLAPTALPAAFTFALAAALAAAPATAHAQFTTAVRPPAERPEQPRTVAQRESVVVARRDSTVEAQRLDLRAWVDSAADALGAGGVPGEPVPPLEPGAPVLEPAAPVTPPPAEGTVEFREGAPAPNTATPLPFLLLIGGGAAALGAALRRR